MEVASLAAMVMFQMRARLDASSLKVLLPNALIEKSSLLTDQDANHAHHTRELKEETLSALLIPALPTKLSLGKVLALTAPLVRLKSMPILALNQDNKDLTLKS